MARTDHLALNAKIGTERDVESIRQNHETAGDFLSGGDPHLLAVAAGRDGNRLGADELDLRDNLRAHGVDHVGIHQVVLIARLLLHHAPEARNPYEPARPAPTTTISVSRMNKSRPLKQAI